MTRSKFKPHAAKCRRCGVTCPKHRRFKVTVEHSHQKPDALQPTVSVLCAPCMLEFWNVFMNVVGVRRNGARVGANILNSDDAVVLHTALAKDIEHRTNELLKEKKDLWLAEHTEIRDKEIQERAEEMLAERRAKMLVGVKH